MTTRDVLPLPSPEELMLESGQPVKHFSGILESIKWKPIPENQDQSRRTMIWNFGNVKVTRSNYPYTSTVYPLEIPYGQSGMSQRWIVFQTRAKELCGVAENAMLPMGILKGKLFECAYTDGHITNGPDPKNPGGQWIQTTMEAWEPVAITEANGDSLVLDPDTFVATPASNSNVSATPEEIQALLIEIAVGKTPKDFVISAQSDSRVSRIMSVYNDLIENDEGVLTPYLDDESLVLDGKTYALPEA